MVPLSGPFVFVPTSIFGADLPTLVRAGPGCGGGARVWGWGSDLIEESH